MKFKTILSTMVVATMLGASVTPVLADDHKGKGKKGGPPKHGHGLGKYKAPPKGHWDNDKRWQNNRRDDDRRREEDRRRREMEARRREDEARRRREADWQRSRSSNSRNDLDRLSDQRQKTKNEWRNIALLSGGVAALGLIQKDNRLVFAGAAGALYSLHRYEQDRKSQAQVDRLRASYFGREYFVRDGRRYDRRVVNKGGQKYYQFVRR